MIQDIIIYLLMTIASGVIGYWVGVAREMKWWMQLDRDTKQLEEDVAANGVRIRELQEKIECEEAYQKMLAIEDNNLRLVTKNHHCKSDIECCYKEGDK